MALLADDKRSDSNPVAGVAVVIAFCAAVVGTARWGLDLGDTWAWVALFIGVFAVGMSVVGLFASARGMGAALVAFTFAGAAIASPWVPMAPVVSLGAVVLLMFGVY